MVKKHSRPVFLNLLQIVFPVTAIISIFHRLSGVLLVLLLPMWLWLLQSSLASEESYQALNNCFAANFTLRFLIWLGVVAAWYHAAAGARHLVMDFGWGESLRCAKISAWVLLGLSVASAVFLAFKLLS